MAQATFPRENMQPSVTSGYTPSSTPQTGYGAMHSNSGPMTGIARLLHARSGPASLGLRIHKWPSWHCTRDCMHYERVNVCRIQHEALRRLRSLYSHLTQCRSRQCEMTDSLAQLLQGYQARSCPTSAQRRPSRARPPGLRAPAHSSSSSSNSLPSNRSLLSPPLPLKR